jgi:two-component system alkaline phosphatase synthesis response regulator PhoP
LANKKILLVDDSNTILMVEKMILASEPYRLVTAGNGAQAVETAAVERPDLILMDVVMPTMDGFAACRALRAREETRAIPVIMVTTRGEAGNVERGFESGCSEYITKPINGPELLAKIRNLLGD